MSHSKDFIFAPSIELAPKFFKLLLSTVGYSLPAPQCCQPSTLLFFRKFELGLFFCGVVGFLKTCGLLVFGFV